MEQKTNRNKIGARCLTPAEAQLILPTYQQIWKQIEQFRLEKDHKHTSQKTNNIGIIGVRGAGKTSLLKTIRAKLEEENKKKEVEDLIFPILVPENMSQSSTLMAAILGMFKEFVDTRVRKEGTGGRDEYCKRESNYKKSYDEVIKQYTYIQKEYRDIMIQEYTTENDYAKSSAKIFNSDVEFQNKFDKLIRLLVQGSEKAMIFLFIDDIDLSTNRCADVVKTLLSYLANENIITFISGDLETFEEALTLDFLRMEGVLEKNILDESMLEGTAAVSILESKKRLSYEYLKKILPPIYRHNIKMWDLEEKGDYCIQSEETDQNESRSFAEGLTRALQGWVDPAFFQYMDVMAGEVEPGKLPYTYHLFDDTSRGLNNVYNVCNDIIDKRERSDAESQHFIVEKKQLLDTMISSKHIYNQYREQMQGKMFFVGAGRSEVSFDNALSVIYPETKEEQEYPIQNPVERFALFIFVDFAARLLYEEEYGKRTQEDDDYQKLKKRAVKDLLLHPEIAGKVRNIEIRMEEWEYDDTFITKLAALGVGFLTKGDLVFNLAFYKGLSLDLIQMLFSVSKDQIKEKHTKEQEQQVFLAFGEAVASIAGIRGIDSAQLLAEGYYAVFWREFQFMQNRLSNLSLQNEVIRLFGTEYKHVLDGKNLYMNRMILNTIAELISDHAQSDVQNDEKHADKETRNTIAIKRIIRTIDKQNLWQELPAEKVVEYLKKSIAQCMEDIIRDAFQEPFPLKMDISYALDAWDKFYQSYDGVSFTKAAQTKQEMIELFNKAADPDAVSGINKSLDHTIGVIKQRGIDFHTLLNIMQTAGKLAGNSYVWYGRVEVQELQNGMLKSFVKIDDLKEKYSDYLDFKFYLTYFYKYKIATGDQKQIQRQAKLLKEITECISTAHQSAEQQVLETFMGQLNEELEDGYKMDSRKFRELFNG